MGLAEPALFIPDLQVCCGEEEEQAAQCRERRQGEGDAGQQQRLAQKDRVAAVVEGARGDEAADLATADANAPGLAHRGL